MENKAVFVNAFGIMINRYKNIFSNIYPAYNKTGFTERNLSHNFASALESVIGDDTISWFEMPTGSGKKHHIDAVTFNIPKKIFVIVEAKRFSNPNKKVPSILRDLERISQETCFQDIEKNCAENTSYQRYVVLLCDVWNESEPKKQILDAWEKGFIKSEVLKLESLNKAYSGRVIHELNLMHRFENLKNTTLSIQNYSILAYVAKVEF